MEAQVRPLMRLPDEGQQVEAWSTAVERSEGQQPSGPKVSEVVFEILRPEGQIHRDPPAVRAKRRIELVAKLREGVNHRSWREVEQTLAELEDLL